MTEYTPDRWVCIEIKSKAHGIVHKILASWYGGYTGSDSWKLSSGNLPHAIDGDIIIFPQESGSVYKCYRDAYGMSNYTMSIYSSLVTQMKDVPEGDIRILEESELENNKGVVN